VIGASIEKQSRFRARQVEGNNSEHNSPLYELDVGVPEFGSAEDGVIVSAVDLQGEFSRIRSQVGWVENHLTVQILVSLHSSCNNDTM